MKTRSGVYFSVYKISGFVSESGSSIIPYDYSFSSIGGGMDLATGIFTAPVGGRYFFTFNAIADSDNTLIAMFFSPGDGPAQSRGAARGENMSISQIRNLNKGDMVFVSILGTGSVSGPPTSTQFTGMLIEEDLVTL